MPTARPIIVARIGVLEPMSMNAVIAVMAGHAERDAEDRGQDRQAGGDERAEGQDQHDERERDADQLRGAAGRRELAHAGAVGLDGQAGRRGRRP